ncbi:MAG: hypothetical protein AAB393_08735, partial [Bacteroidota bacterium]
MLTNQQARAEAERCLYCFDAPCTHACPTHIDIPTFISMIKSGNVRGAAEVVKTSNALANVCGKVCPEEIYCQSVCNRAKEDEPIRIRELHFFATQHEARSGYSPLRSLPKLEKKGWARTPVSGLPLARGSYLLALRRNGFRDAPFPILVGRGQESQGKAAALPV